MTTSLDALVDSARQGNNGALGELFDRFSPLSNRLLAGYRSLSFYDDLPGELFIAFAVLVGKFDPERGIPFSHFMSRMLPMTIHTVVRRERRERSRQLLLIDGWQPNENWADYISRAPSRESATPPTPCDEVVDTVVSRDVLLHLLDNLTPLQSAVFISHAIDDEEFSQIADRLGKSLGAVRFAYFAARQRMKKEWDDEYGSLNGRHAALCQPLEYHGDDSFQAH